MSQDVIISAFRKRLKNRGYRNIHICKTNLPDVYYVAFTEPIFCLRLEGVLTLSEIYHSAK